MIPTLVPFVMMFGASNGMSTLARASSIAQIFGSRHYGAISGAVALGANGARAVGPVGASLLVLALGAYERLFWVLAAGLAVISVAVLLTDPEALRSAAVPSWCRPSSAGSRTDRDPSRRGPHASASRGRT